MEWIVQDRDLSSIGNRESRHVCACRQLRDAIVVLLATAALYCLAAEASPLLVQAQGRAPDPTTMSLEDLMNAEVTTVSRQPSTVGRSPAAVLVITQEDIRRSGATTLPELFRRVPGMDVARIDNNKWAVGVRGFNQRFADKVLVQVDGRSVYSPVFSGVYWDTVDYPLEDIERIEVIRGPGASVWGANAVNGMINIITRSAADTHGGLASGGSGTNERAFGTVRWGGKAGDQFHYRVYGKAFTREPQFAWSGEPHDDWQGARGGLRLDGRLSERDRLTVEGEVLSSGAERRDFRPTASAPFSFTNLENEVTHAGHVLARWSHQIDDESSWMLQAYWDRVDRNGDRGFAAFRSETLDVDLQHQFALGTRQKIMYGAGYRDVNAFLGPSTADGGFALSFPPPHRNSQLFSAFVQDQIELAVDRFTLTLGSKVEHNDFTGLEYQPTVRGIWTPTTRQSLWAAVSRAVRTPKLSEDGIGTRQVPSFPAALGGAPLFPQLRSSPDFQSEELLAYELGYRTQATRTLAVDVALFHNVYNKLRVSVPGVITAGVAPGTFELGLTYQNRMTGETSGAEVAATWQPVDWWRLYGAYTFLNMQLHAGPGIAASSELPEDQSPQHQAYLQASLNLPHRVELDLMGRFVEELSGFGPPVAGYPSADIRIAWQPRSHLTIALTGQNLLQRHHSEFGTTQLLSSLRVEIERGVYGKVTWGF